jgi:cyclopropane-fatty-acyl-phospholipid synthase
MSGTVLARSTDAPRPRLSERLARRAVLAGLQRLRGGRVHVLDRSSGHTLVAGPAVGTGLSAQLVIEDPRAYVEIARRGTLGAAEAYMQGWWAVDDLTSLLRIFVRDLASADDLERSASPWRQALERVQYAMRRNSRTGSRRNIRDHYDLGNDFFSLVLDETMTYSCGFFAHPGTSMREASVAKIDRLCRKLELRPEHRLLEVGTGWGSCAIHAATHYGCRVTTATISPAQHEVALRRVREAGVADRVEVLLRDYRDLEGTFDRLVSIEMIEAVGHRFLPTYFGRCSRLLSAEGVMAIQAITMPDHRYERSLREVDFIQRYVFPGSCVPSTAAMTAAIAQASDLRLVQLEDMTDHYVPTLRAWRRNFLEHLDEIRSLGYDERFQRLWTYYLAYCEAGFAERYTGTVQMVLAKPQARPAALAWPGAGGQPGNPA